MKLVYFNSYSLVYPEVFKTICKSYKIEEVVFYKKGLSQETTDKRLVLFRKQVELQLSLVDPFISVEFQEIPKDQDLRDPKKFESYIESIIKSEYSGFPKDDVIYLIETLAINHIKWALEDISKDWTFILFTNKHKKTLDLSLGGQNWKRLHMVSAETEQSLNKALQKVHKEQSTSRFDHTLRVIGLANKITSWCSLDESTRQKVLVSCAYHDIAKEWTKSRLIYHADKKDPQARKELEDEPWNLHGPVASTYLDKALNLDRVILDAIRHHTKPIENLDIVGKVLVIADKMEPAKKEAFESEKYEELMSKLTQSKVDEVFKYLLENPIKKKRN